MARDAGAVIRLDAEETLKHGLAPGEGFELDAELRPTSTCVSRSAATARSSPRSAPMPAPACRSSRSTSARSGFWPRSIGRRSTMACGARSPATSTCCRCRASRSRATGGAWLAINDISIHRQPGKRVADLEYAVGADEIGRVRCDGLVVATPAGSTGYNLANGGPVMAGRRGLRGRARSSLPPALLFTAPRALVVAPQDALAVINRSRDEPVDVTVDGRPVCALAAGQQLAVQFVHDQGGWPRSPARPSTTGCGKSSAVSLLRRRR